MGAAAENPNLGIKTSSASTLQTHSSDHSRPRFPTHRDAPGISSFARVICETLAHTSHDDVESALSSTGIIPTPDLVEEVLKLCYNSPSSAVDFFRWAGRSQKLSAHAWNLMVDVLGKNNRFEQMWDAVRSMKNEGMVSLPTFASLFYSYCGAGKYDEAIMSFEVMNMYGVEQDVVAVNSLLSAICRQDNQTTRGLEFLNRIKEKIAPDGDSFAILLEGWEKEGNVVEAKKTLGEKVELFGWNPQHIMGYETFLITLIRGKLVNEALKFLRVMKGENCFPSLMFFSNALDILVKLNDPTHAVKLWDIMASTGLMPNLIMYNEVIGLLCNNNDVDNVFRLFDEMVFCGAFPDSLTYNMIFECLIKNKKVQEVEKFFHEMVKNDWPPTHLNCASAITVLLDGEEPETAIDIWNYMVENGILPLEESANALLVGLCNLGRLSDLWRFAEDMLDRGIVIHEATMHKLKKAFYDKSRSKKDRYDTLEKRWKTSQM